MKGASSSSVIMGQLSKIDNQSIQKLLSIVKVLQICDCDTFYISVDHIGKQA